MLKNVVRTSQVVGMVIYMFRLEHNMLGEELAIATGVNPSSWSRLESGKGSICYVQIYLAAKALNIKASAIVRQAEEIEAKLIELGFVMIADKTELDDESLPVPKKVLKNIIFTHFR